jgi:hypothetical protein
MIGLGQTPTVSTPLPFPWVWLAWILGWAGPALASGLFWLWTGPLSHGKPTGGKRTRAAAALIGILSFLWFRAEWGNGLKYEGFRFNFMTAMRSLIFAAVIGTILASPKRANSYIWSLTANFLIFAWAVTYAFPYLGEMP